jgi:endonuclease/exonuclease/phosphatase family metal-dependent hydrolase
MAEPNELRFVWWNVQSFAHLEPERAGAPRYPSCREEYEAKRDRVEAALRHLTAARVPDVIGLCEITEPAARDLRERLFPAHRLVFPVAVDPFQVAVLARERFGFRALAPLRPARVPGTARPVPVLDFRRGSHHLRWYFCHWTAFGDGAALYRARAAEAVSEHMYRFLNDHAASGSRHVVTLGDFNEEPFAEVFAARLFGARDRARARQPAHHTDADVRRVRLYNAGWRLLGERHPHGAPGAPAHAAGTYFDSNRREWRTFDHLFVSGGLLGTSAPFLDESAFGIMVPEGALGARGTPEPFEWNDGNPVGLSDHLPLAGRFVLPEGET